MKYEDIVKAQEGLKTLPIKGKDYVMVHERVKAFRKLMPEGCIKTDIEVLNEGFCVCKTEVYDDAGHLLSTGLAYEREEGTINRVSFIENCQTSSVGRALGFLGIGIDTGIASAEEMENAILQQKKTEQITKTMAEALIKQCTRENVTPEKVAGLYKVQDVFTLTNEMYRYIINHWEEVKERCSNE